MCNHNGFPVMNTQGKYIGLILRSQLTVLLNKKAFSPQDSRKSRVIVSLDEFREIYPRFPDIEDIVLNEEELEMFLNLSPYINPRTYVVNQHTPLHRVFSLFRTMGLRHLVVLDDYSTVVGMITRKDLITQIGTDGLTGFSIIKYLH